MCSSDAKEFACKADLDLIPALGRPAFFRNPMDRGAWWTPAPGVAKSGTQPKD